MKFMLRGHEASRPTPEAPAELFAGIGGLSAAPAADGSLVEVGGLLPIETGSIVTLAGGEISITDGPFVEAKELVGGYAVWDVADATAAQGSASAFLDVHRSALPGWEGWVEVRALMV